MGRRRVRGLTVASLLLLTACNLGQTATPTPSGGDGNPAWQPQTAWERALAKIDDNGRFSLDDALAIFATAFGPLPGTAASKDLTGVFDTTIAINAIEQHYAELTAEQKTAVDDYLKPPADATLISIEGSGATAALAGAVLAQVTDARKVELTSMANNLRDILALKLGFDIPKFDIAYADRPANLQPILGQYPLGGAHGTYGADGGNTGCLITLFNQSTGEGDTVLRSLLAHEIFHCFQYQGYGTYDKKNAAPAWVIEGQAAWVGQAVGGVSGKYDRFWDEYISLPRKSLTTRSYDAIGFYSHLEERGISAWTAFKPMWDAGSNNIEIFKNSGANVDPFIDTWPSGVLRQETRGDGWDTTGPGITATFYSPLSVLVSGGTRIDVSQPFFTNDIVQLEMDADMVHFAIDGHGRLNDGSMDTTALADAWFCVAGHDCKKQPKCANAPPVPDTQGTINPTAYLATSGAIDGTVGVVEGRKIDDDDPNKPCESPKTPRPRPNACNSGGCGFSNGDPHIRTISDDGYDFQAIGEFVLLRSADGNFEVQGRQTRYGTSNDVSVNSAVAMKLGTHRVGIYSDPLTEELTLKVDGAETDAGQPVDLGGGGLITRNAFGFDVDFADGSRLSTLSIGGGYGMNYVLEPSDGLRQSAVGLFGPVPGGDNLGVPALPDGTVLPDVFGREEYWRSLYVTFADAWRVTDTTSLFDYAAGESTATFTTREFPPQPEMVTIEDLTSEQRAAGEAACAGIAIEFLREQCIFDVGITGDAGFFDMFDITATLVDKGSLTGSGERVRVVNLYADDTGGRAIDVYGWSPEGAALVATVEYEQVSQFFDPGLIIDTFGDPSVHLSFQLQGQPVQELNLNLLDLTDQNRPGRVRTIVLAPGDPDDFVLGGDRSIYSGTVVEKDPNDEFLVRPPAEQGALYTDTTGMTWTLDTPTYFYLSTGAGCLADWEFPTVPRRLGGGNGESAEHFVALPPGQHNLTIHLDPTYVPDFDCTKVETTLPPVPITIAAGKQAALFAYARPADPQLRFLLLPFGE